MSLTQTVNHQTCLVLELFRNQDTAASKQQLWSHKQRLQSFIGHQHGCDLNAEHAAAAGACQHNLESDIPLYVYPSIHPSGIAHGRRVLESIAAIMEQRQCHRRANAKSCQLGTCACFGSSVSLEQKVIREQTDQSQSLRLWGGSANHKQIFCCHILRFKVEFSFAVALSKVSSLLVLMVIFISARLMNDEDPVKTDRILY